mmetsp:Transcript_123584/g.357403  ORF Transcript_123584/g.357403 Transcript_123584/m.357403 type:complete len:236 (-) Transcript_123584:154-861(-)
MDAEVRELHHLPDAIGDAQELWGVEEGVLATLLLAVAPSAGPHSPGPRRRRNRGGRSGGLGDEDLLHDRELRWRRRRGRLRHLLPHDIREPADARDHGDGRVAPRNIGHARRLIVHPHSAGELAVPRVSPLHDVRAPNEVGGRSVRRCLTEARQGGSLLELLRVRREAGSIDHSVLPVFPTNFAMGADDHKLVLHQPFRVQSRNMHSAGGPPGICIWTRVQLQARVGCPSTELAD